MRLLVLGAGAIGGYFGGRLVAGGADVTFLVRPARAERLERDGLRIESPVGNVAVAVKVMTAADKAFDVVLLSCKAYDLASAIDAIAPAVGPDTLVLPLLNGLAHYDALDARFGRARVAGGLVQMPGQLQPDGSILHFNTMQRFVYGPRDPSQKEACAALLPILQQGGFDATLTDDVEQAIWEKLVFLAALAGLTCLMRAPIGAIMQADDGRSIADAFVRECVAIATSAGHAPRADSLAETRELLTAEGSTHTASMLRDLGNRGRTEHDHIFGGMICRARAAGISAPHLTLALAHMQAYEALRAGG